MDENKNNQHLTEEELWGKRFEEDMDEYYPQSRSERRALEEEKQGGSSNWLAVAVFVLAALFIIPTLYFAWASNQEAKDFKAEQEKIEVSEKSEAEKKKEAAARKKKEAEKKAKKEKEQAEKEKADKEKEEKQQENEQAGTQNESQSQTQNQQSQQNQQNQQNQVQQNQNQNSQNAQQNQNYSGNTYTVQPQDNLYRIALNHGMTTEELMQLNGLTGTTIQVGQVLKVK